MIMSGQVSLLHYLPLDLIHKVTDLMFDRQHYCMLNTTCRAYNNLKKEGFEEWEVITDETLPEYISNGYRNLRIKQKECFIVNMKYNIFTKHCTVYTKCGECITISNTRDDSKTESFGVLDLTLYEEIHVLVNSYPFIAKSRGIKVGMY